MRGWMVSWNKAQAKSLPERFPIIENSMASSGMSCRTSVRKSFWHLVDCLPTGRPFVRVLKQAKRILWWPFHFVFRHLRLVVVAHVPWHRLENGSHTSPKVPVTFWFSPVFVHFLVPCVHKHHQYVLERLTFMSVTSTRALKQRSEYEISLIFVFGCYWLRCPAPGTYIDYLFAALCRLNKKSLASNVVFISW